MLSDKKLFRFCLLVPLTLAILFVIVGLSSCLDEHDKIPANAPRSSAWARVRATHLLKHPVCEACGTKKELQVHHVISFAENPDLELDPGNLITLCAKNKCHFIFGHLWNYQLSNKDVRKVVKTMRYLRDQANE